MFSIGFIRVPLQSRLFQKEVRQQWDISSECSIVRNARFAKVLQGFWANRVGAVFFGQAIWAGILHFTNVSEGFGGSGFFWPGKMHMVLER